MKKHWILTGLIVALASCAVSASESTEMLRSLLKTPSSEWRETLDKSTHLLDDQFFKSIDMRMSWGIENNHLEDSLVFARVGDFAAEAKKRPATFRLNLAKLLIESNEQGMARDVIDDILKTK